MPTKFKLLLSILVVAIAVLMFMLQRDLGNSVPSYICLFVGALMVLGMWIFPEVRKESPHDARRPPPVGSDQAL
jgi:hypothetical protein